MPLMIFMCQQPACDWSDETHCNFFVEKVELNKLTLNLDNTYFD